MGLINHRGPYEDAEVSKSEKGDVMIESESTKTERFVNSKLLALQW